MKKIVSMLVAAVLIFSMAVFAEETAPSDWAVSEINSVYPEMFKSMQAELNYQRPITRAEFAMLSFSVYKEVNGGLPQIQTRDVFDDVGAEMVDMFVPMAAAVGIVRGVSSTEFMPRNPITRQELCTMISRIFMQLDPQYAEKLAESAGAADKFSDAATISDWAKDAMNYCVAGGIIQGMSETQLSPLSTVSVEQAMVICSRIVTK